MTKDNALSDISEILSRLVGLPKHEMPNWVEGIEKTLSGISVDRLIELRMLLQSGLAGRMTRDEYAVACMHDTKLAQQAMDAIQRQGNRDVGSSK